MLSHNGIKAIFYDLDGTLRTNNPPGRVAFADHAVSLGISLTPEDILRATRWEHHYFGGAEEIHADQAAFPDPQSFWMNYNRRQLIALGASPQQADELAPQLNKYMNEQYRPQDVLLPKVHEALKMLKDAGYILAVVSNRNEPYQDYLQEIGLGEYFDFSLAAGEVNSWKPDKGVFEHALHRADIQAHQAIYVGDNYFADVMGSRNAGMNPVLLDAHGVFEQPGCPVISSHNEIFDLLEKGDVWIQGENKSRLI